MKIVSVINHKGGVGKTTFAGCTAQALSLVGFRVLAIDNDSQHNLSTMLGTGVLRPGIRDVYKATASTAAEEFLRAVRKTDIPNLHIITSCSTLCNSDVQGTHSLKNCLQTCRLERFYDFIIIDNAPGLDRLQTAAIWACDSLFVPTELKQFAVDGLVELANILSAQFTGAATIEKIIPNFYRNTKRHNGFIAALNNLFPGKVTQTAIPHDPVFDEVTTLGKTLFLHRLASKGAAFYLKLIHELFDLDENKVWEMVMSKRNDHRKEEARHRLLESNAAPS
jgi:chromosome partitioning protein